VSYNGRKEKSSKGSSKEACSEEESRSKEEEVGSRLLN
jgi:hypothetical protein